MGHPCVSLITAPAAINLTGKFFTGEETYGTPLVAAARTNEQTDKLIDITVA